MLIIKTVDLLHKTIKSIKDKKNIIGLVPTMGSLHKGHKKLILFSKKHVDIIIVSIFVNPMQFNNLVDLKNYPKNFKKDCAILKKIGVNIVFIPEFIDIYPNGISNHTFIEVTKLSNILEGRLRPGHFRGVTTIISKLFNMIQPNFAFFGKKDYQQLLIIKKLVKDLNYTIKIVSFPTVRLKNGLALSSRNTKLTAQQKKIAPYLYKIIEKTSKKIIKQKFSMRKKIINESKIFLIKKGFLIETFNIYDCDTLKIASKKNKNIIILTSVWLGQTRLIDNQKIFD